MPGVVLGNLGNSSCHVRDQTCCLAQEEGAPGSATPALSGADEERIQAFVAERVRAKLLDFMEKACDKGRQKVRQQWLDWGADAV